MKTLQIGIAVLALALGAPALADHGHGHDKGSKHGKSDDQGDNHFRDDDREHFKSYYAAHPEERDQLPPGLAKKGKVPPGWQKKLAVGHPVPDDVWEMRAPLPPEIVVRLPAPPPGVVLVRIGDQIIRARERTHEVLDRYGIPHPP